MQMRKKNTKSAVLSWKVFVSSDWPYWTLQGRQKSALCLAAQQLQDAHIHTTRKNERRLKGPTKTKGVSSLHTCVLQQDSVQSLLVGDGRRQATERASSFSSLGHRRASV